MDLARVAIHGIPSFIGQSNIRPLFVFPTLIVSPPLGAPSSLRVSLLRLIRFAISTDSSELCGLSVRQTNFPRPVFSPTPFVAITIHSAIVVSAENVQASTFACAMVITTTL